MRHLGHLIPYFTTRLIWRMILYQNYLHLLRYNFLSCSLGCYFSCHKGILAHSLLSTYPSFSIYHGDGINIFFIRTSHFSRPFVSFSLHVSIPFQSFSGSHFRNFFCSDNQILFDKLQQTETEPLYQYKYWESIINF